MLVDEEPIPFDGALIEIVEPLRGATPDKFPQTFPDVTYGDEVMELVVTSVDEEHMEPGDMMLEGLLGKEQWPVQIWWDQEMGSGHVDASCFLSTALEKLAARFDLTPPEDHSTETIEIQDITGWNYDCTRVALDMIDLGDPEQELHVVAFFYSAFGREAEVEAGLQGVVEYDTLSVKDANGDSVRKFAIGPMKANKLSRIISSLDSLNKEVELTIDLAIMWP
jgi:hypothetical protein